MRFVEVVGHREGAAAVNVRVMPWLSLRSVKLPVEFCAIVPLLINCPLECRFPSR